MAFCLRYVAEVKQRVKIRATKAHLEMKLPRNVGVIKSFFKYINCNRQCRNNFCPLQDEDGCLGVTL